VPLLRGAVRRVPTTHQATRAVRLLTRTGAQASGQTLACRMHTGPAKSAERQFGTTPASGSVPFAVPRLKSSSHMRRWSSSRSSNRDCIRLHGTAHGPGWCSCGHRARLMASAAACPSSAVASMTTEKIHTSRRSSMSAECRYGCRLASTGGPERASSGCPRRTRNNSCGRVRNRRLEDVP
jgi:hypothetical protein